MENTEKAKKPGRRRVKIWKVFLALILAVVICLAGALAALTVTEYRPKDVERITPSRGEQMTQSGANYTIVSCNIGYGALGKEADFFMDGGETTRPASTEVVNGYLAGLSEDLKKLDADVYMLQEVDTNSHRSYNVDEASFFEAELGMTYSYALNYRAGFVPYPVTAPLGKVSSGLATYTDLKVDSAERVQLPIPFSWPIRCINLKRCLLIERLPVEGSDAELVIINLHLEAYDSGEGKLAQTKQLYSVLEQEYAKGNYVIAGGDFNQTFPTAKLFPDVYEGVWVPGVIEDTLPEGFAFTFGGDEPTCRLLDKPLVGNDNPQYYIIDGFIVSDNVTVNSVEVVDLGFANTDHQPIILDITLN